MQTLSPTHPLDPCELDEQPAGDPACRMALVVGALHVCTDRDGAVVTAASDKACWAWARREILTAAEDEYRARMEWIEVRADQLDEDDWAAWDIVDGSLFPVAS